MSSIRKPLKLSNLSLPIISLFTGKLGTVRIQNIFSQYIEDFLIPFFCISGNVSSYQEAIHTHGLAWEALRASIAIPGLLPPMVLNEQLHVDGGIINNLPVDRMRAFLGPNSKIIAISLGGNNSKTRYAFPPFLSNIDLLKYSLNSKINLIFPKFGNFLMNAFLMGASSREIEARALANIVVRPNVSPYNMIGVTEKQEEELIELGYRETLLQVEKYGIKNLGLQI